MRGDLGNRERKIYLKNQKLIRCSICKYHRRENIAVRVPRPDKYKNINRLSIRKLFID
jgi:hypothetical protein